MIPLDNNGYVFELFIQDCYMLCDPDKFGIIEAKRAEEYAPIKKPSREAEDSTATARELMSKLHRGWLQKHAVEFEGNLTSFAGI